MIEEIEQLQEEAVAAIQGAADPVALEEFRVRFTGRRSQLRTIMSGIGDLSEQERPAVGQAAGRARKAIDAALHQRTRTLEEAGRESSRIDVSLPGRRPMSGVLHPLTRVAEELVTILEGMGFTVADGPEVDDEYHNFDALNTPADHPSRDLHDTFYLKDGRLLRTQTSTVQIRVMESGPPPVRIISPGRVYRRDTVDATHHMVFHQIEGLYVDKGVSMGDLKATLTAVGRRVMGESTRIRLRPHFFPFTEPSVEYDFSCGLCSGADSDPGGPTCRLCKGTGWIEIGGAGMVDPAVFEAVGYDPEVYTGFAFGLGFDRISMIRHGIDDIRLFLENDLRFTRQF
ncbi:MAG: phenylalanine--tRNA ligase subunit alpha [Gemmatimonadetes bacterium]|jgi:phenylalanyl-tRNA synthetase alpha chain|nr:phenylalanine--tRNA ligase subunit alpha [Gemmatimonadota bacterium]